MKTVHNFLLLFLCFIFISQRSLQSVENISITLSQQQIKNLELLMNGSYAPLNNFMDKNSYESVVNHMHLPDGTFFPYPIILEITEKIRQKIAPASQISLCDLEGAILAQLEISEIWPNENSLLNPSEHLVAGKLIPLSVPKHYDFTSMRKTPAELVAYFQQQGHKKVIAYPTAHLLQRTHVEYTSQAANNLDAHLCLFPIDVTPEQSERDYFTLIKCLEKIIPYYPAGQASINLLPLSSEKSPLKAILGQSIVCKNCGCTHMIVEDQTHEAKNLIVEYAKEVGIEILFLDNTSTQQENYPEVTSVLEKTYPNRNKQGFTLFMTGFSGAGKSTIAKAVAAKLMEIQDRQVTILDGDLIRTHLSSELGFSKEHRSINVRRVGFVASEISKNGGIAICALIAPYAADRQFVRNIVNKTSNYIEIFVSTPLTECEKRDPKNLYAKARQGILKGFTGIDDPYEVPLLPEILLDTSGMDISESIEIILDYLYKEGFLLQE